METGIRSLRPWSRAGERYAGPAWPQIGERARGRDQADHAAVADAGPAAGRWDDFVRWGERFYVAAGFCERELNGPLATAEQLRRARGAVLSRARTATWRTLFERAAAAASPPPAGMELFVAWCTTAPDAARAALRTLWADSAAGAGERVEAFCAALPDSISASGDVGVDVASILLAALDPMRYPAVLAAEVERGCALTGHPPALDTGAGARYEWSLAFLDRIIREATARGVPLRHRLHAAAVLRCVTCPGVELPDAWSEAERRAFRMYRSGPATALPGATSRSPAPRRRRQKLIAEDRAPRDATLEQLAERLLLDAGALRTIERLLADRGQCIFYGPPGTGKTYVARELAHCLAGDAARVDVVQLHPSYAYEDFVEGYRPSPGDGSPGFELVDGPLKRAAAAAAADPAHRYVLVVDEVNRANVAGVFGELYYLLEYRDQAITLQYSRAPFSLPRNLWLVGTMNAADRSIALVDLALRRRFYFVPFFPDEPPIEGLLRRWLGRHHPSLLWLADAVDEANRRLGDRRAAIGPSHFLRSDLSEEWIGLIWEHAVLPALAEHFAGDETALAEFRLARLRRPRRGRATRVVPPYAVAGEREVRVAEDPAVYAAGDRTTRRR